MEFIILQGAEVVAFISVNDVYVMRAWENVQQTKGKVTMISDGNGELSASVSLSHPCYHVSSHPTQPCFCLV